MLGIFLLIAISFFSVWWHYLTSRNKEFFRRIPGPPASFLFGTTSEFKSTSHILDVILEFVKKYGGIMKIHSGPFRKTIIATDYDFLEFILSSNRLLHKSSDYEFFKPWLGTGLLTSTGTKWRQHRRILTPAFHFQILEQFIEIFESGGAKLVEKLEKEVGKNSIDIYSFVTLCTLDIICETAMGTKIGAQERSDSEYVRCVKIICKLLTERSIYLLRMWPWTYPLTESYYKQKAILEVLHRHTNGVINQRREELRRNPEKKIKGKLAFLDLLLQATVDGNPLTQEEIREEVDTFMFEGHDTTASAISFTLFCLANHPEVQAQVLEEQVALFGNFKNATPTYADLQGMKYLEQVIKESLRLYPPVPIYGRKTDEPLEFNGTIIPKDVVIKIFAYGVHRDPKFYPNPEKFDPSRFDSIHGTKPYAFIPFSAGSRNCIGQKFAMLEMKSTISKIVRKFELCPATPEHKLKLVVEAVLKSYNGIRISLNPRH